MLWKLVVWIVVSEFGELGVDLKDKEVSVFFVVEMSEISVVSEIIDVVLVIIKVDWDVWLVLDMLSSVEVISVRGNKLLYFT